MLATSKAVYIVAFYLSLVMVLVLSLLPLEHPDFSPNDKWNHGVAYCALTLLGYLAYRRLWLPASLVLLFGILIEFMQGMTEFRVCSYGDMLANSAGVLLGCAVILIANKTFKLWTRGEAL